MSWLTDLAEGFAGTELQRVAEQKEVLHAKRVVQADGQRISACKFWPSEADDAGIACGDFSDCVLICEVCDHASSHENVKNDHMHRN